MDEVTLQRLIEKTELLHDANDWSAVDALWRPYVAQGDVEAQFRLAYYYLFYSFDKEPQIRAEMEKLLRTAAERDHADAVYRLSHLYPDGTERDAMLLKAGELGGLDGQRDLGAFYGSGNSTGPHDAVRAAEWYHRAAERGHADAQYNLGFIYLLGEGVPTNPAEGLRWLRLAADQGELASLRLLADSYRNGDYGVSVNPAEAARWHERYRLSQQVRAAGKTEVVDRLD